MKEKVLILKDMRQVQVFAKALRKAVPGGVEAWEDHGWPRPALRVRGATLGQILAAATWAGFEPQAVLE